jgi:hypothetical protein
MKQNLSAHTFFTKLLKIEKIIIYQHFFKETVSRDFYGLLVMWMNSVLFGDEPLTVVQIVLASWFLTSHLTFFRGSRGSAHSLFHIMSLEHPSCKCVGCCWLPSGKFVTGG